MSHHDEEHNKVPENMEPLSVWQQYKKNLGSTRPWDMLDKKVPRTTDEVAKRRLEICNSCVHLTKLTQQCKKCGCFMALKVKLAPAGCPINKWDAVEEEKGPERE
jgi:hypothetical protein